MTPEEITKIWQRIIKIEERLNHIEKLRQADIQLLNNTIENFNMVVSGVRKLADDAKKDIDWFNTQKLPMLAQDIDSRFEEMKKEILEEISKESKSPKKSRWNFLRL